MTKTKELIIRVYRYEDQVLLANLVETIGSTVIQKIYDVTARYYDIHAELTRDQSVIVLESLNGKGLLLAPKKATQA